MNQITVDPEQPNQTTRDVIAFLTHPDLDFGHSPPDLELLAEPQAMHNRVHHLLDDAPAFLAGQREAQDLQARLGETDWAAVAREFQSRINLTSQFFSKDAEEQRNVNRA